MAWLNSDDGSSLFGKRLITSGPVDFEVCPVLNINLQLDKGPIEEKKIIIDTAQQADRHCKPAYGRSHYRVYVTHTLTASSIFDRVYEVEAPNGSTAGTTVAQTNGELKESCLA